MPLQLCNSPRWKRVSGPNNRRRLLEIEGMEIHFVGRKHLSNAASNLDSVAEDFPDRRVELIVGQVGMY